MNEAWSSTHRPWPPWLCFAVAAAREGGRIGLVSVNGSAAHIDNLTLFCLQSSFTYTTFDRV
jgi:hypothetical protein